MKARLVYDSSRCRELVGVRAGLAEGRSLSFRGSAITVDVVLSAEDGDAGFAFGQVLRNSDGSPVQGAAVGLDASPPVQSDACGQFALPTGPVRNTRFLSVRTAEHHVACTIQPMR